MKNFSKGFIDGYSYNVFDYDSSDSDKTYYLDFHEGRKKRQVHELILNLCGNFGIESFEENQKMELDVIGEW